MQQIVVININFIAAPPKVVAKIVSQGAFRRDIRCQRSDGDVVSVNRSERAVISGRARIKESIVVEIIAPRRFALVVKACQ